MAFTRQCRSNDTLFLKLCFVGAKKVHLHSKKRLYKN